jgi:hypothetical protein
MPVLVIDPPEGWRYGFPKVSDLEKGFTSGELAKFLLDNGYPVELIELGIKRSRYWEHGQ